MALPPPPSWYSRVTVSSRFHARTIAIDANTLIYFLERPTLDDDLRFVFESPPTQLVLKIGRQVINETLHPVLSRPGRRWQSVEALVSSGKLIMFGVATMSPDERRTYQDLRTVLRVCISEEDAAVVADSLIYRLLLFTREIRLRNAITGALKNAQVMDFLGRHGLATSYPAIVAD